MKLRQIFTLSCVLPMLMACNPNDISGRYGFQLGKDTGTHFGVFMDLKNSTFVPKESTETGFKDFTLTVSINMSSGDDSEVIQTVLDIIADEEGNASLPGYYKLTDEKNTKGERRLKVGFDFEIIVDRAANYFYKATDTELDKEEITKELSNLNDSGFIQSLLYVTHKEDYVYFYIPVSLEDALFQIYWYGYDLRATKSTDPSAILPYEFSIVEVEAHPFGSHPTEEEIKDINDSGYAENHVGIQEDLKYRDYNAVKTGLSKK